VIYEGMVKVSRNVTLKRMALVKPLGSFLLFALSHVFRGVVCSFGPSACV
jgi:hypothetical protein